MQLSSSALVFQISNKPNTPTTKVTAPAATAVSPLKSAGSPLQPDQVTRRTDHGRGERKRLRVREQGRNLGRWWSSSLACGGQQIGLPAPRDVAERAACVDGRCFPLELELAAGAGSRRRCVRGRAGGGGGRAGWETDLGEVAEQGFLSQKRCNRGNGPDDVWAVSLNGPLCFGTRCLGSILKRAVMF